MYIIMDIINGYIVSMSGVYLWSFVLRDADWLDTSIILLSTSVTGRVVVSGTIHY